MSMVMRPSGGIEPIFCAQIDLRSFGSSAGDAQRQLKQSACLMLEDAMPPVAQALLSQQSSVRIVLVGLATPHSHVRFQRHDCETAATVQSAGSWPTNQSKRTRELYQTTEWKTYASLEAHSSMCPITKTNQFILVCELTDGADVR